MVGKTISHYRILEKLGGGGMGVVYRAHDKRLDRDVALKLLPAGTLADETARRRFRKEALTLSQLNHPNIAVVHDFDTEGGVDFLAMEYVAGETLEQKLTAGALPENEVVAPGTQSAEALEEAHGRNIIHRDLKPGNVMVTAKGRVKVLDFGLAELVRPIKNDAVTAESVAQTEAGVVMGTVPHMAPEQLQGKVVDARADAYALGAVLYEMATGRRPFPETQGPQLIAAILTQPPQPPRKLNGQVSLGLDALILKALEKDPARRHQSAKELLIDLAQLSIPGSVVGAWRATTRRRWALAAMAASLFGLLVTLLALNVNKLRERPPGRTTPSQIDSVAALPSKVYASKEDVYLTDAVPSTISTHLAQVAGLETKVPPTSLEVERFGGDLGKVADVYGVRALVVSSISAQADRFVFSVQLVEPQSRRVLWSNEYEGQRASYIELARQAADGLRQALRPASSPMTSVAGLAVSSEAELAFRQGQYYSNRYNNLHQVSDFDLAFSAFKRALELDPKLAKAPAEIAMLYVFKVEAGAPARETIPEMESWARDAIRRDPRCSKAWTVLSAIEAYRPGGSSPKLLEYPLKAAAFEPRDAMAHVGLYIDLERGGSLSLALAAARESSRLDPLYLYAPLGVADELFELGRATEGLPVINEVLRIEPRMPYALYTKTFLLIDLNRLQEAEDLV